MRWPRPDGCLYGRRKVVENGDKTCHYMYCTVKGCKAGFILTVMGKSVLSKWNGKPHTHPVTPSVDIVEKNRQQLEFRGFVREHIHLESRQILTLMLKEDTDHRPFPSLGSINVKLIDNIKGQITGTDARYALRSLVPGELQNIDGVNFLAVQAVKPLVLIFGTENSLSRLRMSGQAKIIKLRLKWNLINNVFCVYAVENGRPVPAVWVLFDDETSSIPWAILKWKISQKDRVEAESHSRVWLVPVSPKYMGILRHLMNVNDHIKGISASYNRYIRKRAETIHDENLRNEVVTFFEREIPHCALCSVLEKLSDAREQWQSEDVRQYIAWWKTLFEDQTFLYHVTIRCDEPSVSDCWLSNKCTPLKCTTDCDIIATIHQQYKEIYTTTTVPLPTTA